jgi:hypothetical protein
MLLQDLEGLLAAFDEERRVMGQRHADAEARATQLQAQVGLFPIHHCNVTAAAEMKSRWGKVGTCHEPFAS